MRIFILRHGETDCNIKGIHQSSDVPLSKNGKFQARQVVRVLKKLPITKIYASPMVRAQQTAKIITKKLCATFSTLEQLEEVRRPSEVRGKKYGDTKAILIKKQIATHFHEVDWHHSDEENFFDMKNRATLLLEKIKKNHKKKDTILLITHGRIIRMIIALVLFGDSLNPKDFLYIYNRLTLNNTGLSAIDYVASNEWNLIFWNDNSHFRDTK